MKIKAKFLISSLFLIGLLSACGSSNDSSDLKDFDSKNPEDISGEITVWSWNEAADALDASIEDFNKEYPDVDVTVEKIGHDDVNDKLTTGLASGGGSGLPDVVTLESDKIDTYINKFPEGFVNLSEAGFDEYEDDFTKSKVDPAKDSDGNFIAMPWDMGPVGVFYRKDYFEKADVDPSSIDTWDDYIEAGEKIKDATDAKMTFVEDDQNRYRAMLNGQEGSYFDENGDIAVTSDKSLNVMSILKEMADKDILMNAPNSDSGATAMKNGEVATIPTAVWYIGRMEDQAPELSGKWGVFDLPSFEKNGTKAAAIGGSNLMIPSSSENKEAAYAFSEYFTTNADVQLQSFKEESLFPSLTETYEDSFFEEEKEYFDNQPIYEKFAEIAEEAPEVNFTSDYSEAQDIMDDSQDAVVLKGKSPEEVLEDAAERIKQSTEREMSKE